MRLISALLMMLAPWLVASVQASASNEGILVKSRVQGQGELLPAQAVLTAEEVLHIMPKAEPGFRLKQIHGCDGYYQDGIFIIEKARYSCVVDATFVPDKAKLVADVNLPAVSSPAAAATQQAAAAGGAARKSNLLKFIVVAHRVVNMVSVTASIVSGIGSISPVQQSLQKGQSAMLTVTPGLGHVVGTVSGCGLNTSGSGVLQTPVLQASCAISVTFVALGQGLWDQFNWDQATWS